MKKIDFKDGKFVTEEVEHSQEIPKEEIERLVKITLPEGMNIIKSKTNEIFIRLDVEGWKKITAEEVRSIIKKLNELLR